MSGTRVERSWDLESALEECETEREYAFNHPGYKEVYGRLNDLRGKYFKPKPILAKKPQQSVKKDYAMPWTKNTKAKKELELDEVLPIEGGLIWYRTRRVTHEVKKVIGKLEDF